jgi:hypothetical protein
LRLSRRVQRVPLPRQGSHGAFSSVVVESVGAMYRACAQVSAKVNSGRSTLPLEPLTLTLCVQAIYTERSTIRVTRGVFALLQGVK